MKTKFRILITVCTLAFVGVLNANATVNFGENNSGLIRANESLSVLNEKIASFESDINESIDYQKEAQMVTRWIVDMTEAKAVQRVMERGFVAPNETTSSFENEVENENNEATTDLAKEAQLMIKLIADKEEAKAVQRVMERGFVAPNETTSSFENEVGGENNNATIDLAEEAQLMIKSIADKEEAKAVQRVMERGFVAPNETTSSFENEVENENNETTTDLAKEAQLMTKLIADKEEAKAVQRVMERGFVVPNETTSLFENEVGNETNEATTDLAKEAQLMIKLIADNEEAKAVQRVMERGFVAPNETFSSFENEVGNENNEATTDLAKEAQLMIKLIADKEEAKAVQRVMERGFVALNETTSLFENEVGNENNEATTDLAKEAQSMIKLIADKAEAKAIQRVMERGFVAPNETTSLFENEVGNENNEATTNLAKEVQLMIKLIADKEEAKAIQRLIAEVKLDENK